MRSIAREDFDFPSYPNSLHCNATAGNLIPVRSIHMRMANIANTPD